MFSLLREDIGLAFSIEASKLSFFLTQFIKKVKINDSYLLGYTKFGVNNN